MEKYEDLIQTYPKIKEVDRNIFEELIGMLTGNPALMYLELNGGKSGLEAWRGLHSSNDPKTFRQSDVVLQKSR